MQVRLAESSDVDAVVAFARAVVPAHYAPILGEAAAEAQLSWWAPDRMAAAVMADRVHVAVADDVVVGVVETGAYGGEQVIWKLYLAPAVRGQGLGRRVLRAAIDALPAGTDHVLVEHFAGNGRAGAFYEREGFRPVGQVATEPDAVVWRRLDLDAAPGRRSGR